MRYRLVATVFCFAVAAFGASIVASTQPLSFSRQDSASASGARGIVSVDLNRDGWPDVALANSGRNSVTVMLNHNGALSKASEIAVGVGPFDIATADFDRDGKPDLAVTNADANTVTVLFGAGDGTFPRHVTLAPTSAQSLRGIAAGDVNGDGTVDLVVTGYTSNSVSVLLGDGRGGFTAGPAFFGYAAQPQGVAIVDLNHDGRNDLVVADDSTGGLAVMMGNGTSNLFAAPKAVTGAQYLNVVTVGDFNGDGWTDVAAASTKNSRVAVFLGGASGLVFNASYAVGSSPRGITAADVDDDGALDLVVANYGSSTVSVLLGDKTHPGAFNADVEFAAGSGSRAIAVADFNHDARLDIVTGNQNAATTTALVNEMVVKPAAFSFTKSSTGGSSSFGGDHPELADFNHDGKLDVVTRAGDTSTALVVSLAGGGTVSLTTSSPYYIDQWFVGDLTGDGNADVLAVHGYPSTLLSLFVGNGKGAFTRVETTMSLTFYNGALGDMNGDGRTDLAFAGYDQSTENYIIGVYRTNASGAFTLAAKQSVDSYVAGLTLADVDRDGKLEALALLYPNSVAVWSEYAEPAGFGGFRRIDVSLPNSPSGVAVGDVNHDGYPDLIVTTDEQMALLLGGSAGFGSPHYFDQQTVGGNWIRPVIADINLDGNPDLITDQGTVLFGNGDGTFQSPQRFDFGFNSEGISVADVNHDGLPDLIVGGSVSQVITLLNSRNDVNHPPTVSAGGDVTANYQDQFGEEFLGFGATGSDPDAHALSYVWKDQNSKVVSNTAWVDVYPPLPPGTYSFTVSVSDGRGASATDSMTLTIHPFKEIVVWAADGYAQGTAWTQKTDASAAGGVSAYNPNKNAPKVNSPASDPASYYAIGFVADPTQTYKLWVRLKADYNASGNDSVWMQFKSGRSTTYAMAVNLEECSGCGESGWGWEDDGWGSVNKNGITLQFPDGGYHEVWIQQREDGVSIDQIVLSSEKYLTKRPGSAKNDATILSRTYQPSPD
jgi:hypothetical protein